MYNEKSSFLYITKYLLLFHEELSCLSVGSLYDIKPFYRSGNLAAINGEVLGVFLRVICYVADAVGDVAFCIEYV